MAIDPEKRAARQARRQERHAAARERVEDIVGEWRVDHKIDEDEIPAIKKDTAALLKAAALVVVDAFDGEIGSESLGYLRSAAIAALVTISVALED